MLVDGQLGAVAFLRVWFIQSILYQQIRRGGLSDGIF